jgi:hypothetical protein
MMFILDLDIGTYTNQTTKGCLFDGKPDQMQTVLGYSRGDHLYFTEEGGENAGSMHEIRSQDCIQSWSIQGMKTNRLV